MGACDATAGGSVWVHVMLLLVAVCGTVGACAAAADGRHAGHSAASPSAV